MLLNRTISILFLAISASAVMAQGEVLRALSARPVEPAARTKDGVNRTFRYQYLTQQIPLMDDFSIDRTRKLNASETDAGVTLDQTIYRLEVSGVSSPGMRFSLDSTFRLTVDNSVPPITTREGLPSVMVTVRDITVDPPTSNVIEAWPAYSIRDTIDNPTPDTTFQVSPALVQDSLLVYGVPPSTGTYLMGNQTVPLILWQDDNVYVNGTYPIDPPTVGVATFDGLARTGYPYNFLNYGSYGRADALTSVPINLEYPASDSIYLSFFYQTQGLSGDSVAQPMDSLILEFYAPLEQTWYRVWGIPYVDPVAFQQILVPVKEARFLKPNFQFRFVNYATLSGSFDHWHLDYVRLGAQRTFNDVRLIDMGYVYPGSGILQTYTSVPFNRFQDAPASNMAVTAQRRIRNLDIEDRFITYGMRVHSDDGGFDTSFENGINTSGNAASIFTTENSVNSAPNNFVFDNSTMTDAAFWNVKFWAQTQPDLIRYNDTIHYRQEMSNYYAYDDGSAEAGYGLTIGGAKLAYRFDLLGPDSLRAIRMYFNPISNPPPAMSPLQGSFLVTIWKSISPEVIQHQNFSFSSPRYRFDGVNKFVEYPLDSAIYVEGTIYIGWTQTNATQMNLGFDRNRNNRPKIFFKTGGTWNNTSFNGSLMMHPVMVAAVDPWASVSEEPVQGELVLYPNPTNDGFRIRTGKEVPVRSTVECMDATGRMVQRSKFSEGAVITTNDMAEGIYLVRLKDPAGMTIAQSRLVVQR